MNQAPDGDDLMEYAIDLKSIVRIRPGIHPDEDASAETLHSLRKTFAFPFQKADGLEFDT